MQSPTDDNRQKASKAQLIAEIQQLERQLKTASQTANSGNSLIVSSFLNALPVGIAYLDANQTYKFANEKYQTLLNLHEQVIIGKQMHAVVDTETYALTESAVDKVFHGTPVNFQIKLTTGEKERHLNLNYLPDQADGDAVVGFFAMVHDATTQHFLQSELAGSEKRYQTLVDAVPHGIEEIDTDGNILFANATHHRQYGYGPNELIGMNIVDLLPPGEAAEPLLQHLKRLAREQPQTEPYYGKKKKKNGDLIDVQIIWTYKHDSENNVIGFTTVISDVTEQKNAERIQKENADRLELSLRSANIGTFSWNVVDESNFWDNRMHDIWGLPHGSFINHKTSDFMNTIFPDDREKVTNAVTMALQDDAPYDIEYRIIRPDGTIAFVEVLASVDRDAKGQPTKLSGVCLDISERKIIEKMKSEFVSTVSHELRTPLTSIRGALGLVTGGALGEIPTAALDIIGLAEKNAAALTKLVNDILDFERADSGKLKLSFERFNLITFLQDNLRSHQGLADRYEVQFQLSQSEPYIEVEADSHRMAQVMANLLSNAAKYSPKGAVINVAVQATETDVEIFVSDKGPGIPQPFQGKVFERFTQAEATDSRNFGGTGLGLSISKLIIDDHGGEIDFISSPEQGTTFRIKFPRLPAVA
ncbi:MAG: PAS domain-containing sensor histidine kinase [Rhodospirillales bacterium]|nr:PAS domain-containing sensor histidine kinase [Rhodospirillales bacterium]